MSEQIRATVAPGQLVNLPDIVAEVRAVFEQYERALIAHDIDALAASFWDSELTVRYGLSECLYGRAAIVAWRSAEPPLPAGRRTGSTVIATFGEDFACVSTEFGYPGSTAVGRQSQTWVRTADGWRIVSAHISMLGAAA